MEGTVIMDTIQYEGGTVALYEGGRKGKDPLSINNEERVTLAVGTSSNGLLGPLEGTL